MGIQKNILSSITIGLITAGLFSSTLYVFATPPASQYNPGETPNPTCEQGDTNCSVNSPSYSFGVNDFSGTGDFTTTGTITGILNSN